MTQQEVETQRENYSILQNSTSSFYTWTFPPWAPKGILTSTLPSCRLIFNPLSLISDSLRVWPSIPILMPLSLNWPWTNGDGIKGTVHSRSDPSAVTSSAGKKQRKETFYSHVLQFIDYITLIYFTNSEHRQQQCQQLGSCSGFCKGWWLGQSLNPLRSPEGKTETRKHSIHWII